jgi:hypothetical protein
MISNPIKVEALDNYKIRIEFEDGTNGEVNLSYLKGKGIFEAWNDYSMFKNVYIDEETKSIAWSSDIEIDSNNLYLKLIGKTFEQWKSENLEYASDK